MRLTLPRILAVVVVVLLIVGAVVLITAPGKYKVTALVPGVNPSVLEGSDILVNGFAKGTVESLKPSGPGVEMQIALDGDVAPLHTGATLFTQWSATVGDRLIQINDGPKSNPEIPDGGRLEGNFPKPMEVSDVLAGLDPGTRAKIAPLAASLKTALGGSEQDLNNTLRTAGPAFTAIGNLTKGLSIDGPALNQLVNDTNALVSRIGARSQDLSGIITDFSTTTRDTAAVRAELRQTLQKLPPTLDQATATLAKVPDTVDETVPLLEDLKAPTDRLPGVARNLAPVLQDLRPTIGELKPTLKALDRLLGETPGLLDQARSTVPKVTDTLDKLTPTLKTLRPFTPCAVGLLSTAFGNGARNNGNGQLIPVPARFGLSTVGPTPVPSGAPLAPQTCDPYNLPATLANAAANSTTSASAGSPLSSLTGGLN